jgi:hypothetical protein
MMSENMVCGGTARLPQSPSGATTLLTVEVEVDRLTRSVTAVYVTPELQGLQRRLQLATGSEQEALFREKARRLDELNTRYPEVIRTQHTRRRLRESPADDRRRS